MISDRNPPPSNRQLLILLGIFLSFIALIIFSLSIILDWAITQIPISVEQKLGALIVPFYKEQAKSSSEQDSLNRLLDRLEANLDNKLAEKRDYQILYIPEATVNALAIPGEQIIIFEGLVKAVKSENELMMILGHELGHFTHRDHLKSLGRTLMIKMIIASIFGDSRTLANSAAIAIETISNSRYSQSQEYQADEFGLMLLNKTYGHVAGATDFFTRLSQKEHSNWDFLSTHPASQRRVKKLEQLIKQNQYQLGKKLPLLL